MRMPCPWREYSSSDKRLNHGIQKNTFSCFFLTGIWPCFQDHEFEDGITNSRLAKKCQNSRVQFIFLIHLCTKNWNTATHMTPVWIHCPSHWELITLQGNELPADLRSHWPSGIGCKGHGRPRGDHSQGPALKGRHVMPVLHLLLRHVTSIS